MATSIDHLSGMVWSAGLVVAALAFVGARVLRGLRRAPVPGEARLPVALAFVNVLAAAAAGILLALDKTDPFLPAPHFPAVLAHAHLAALGWAGMMVIGAGYRMLPMILPSAMPRGRWAHAATLLTQAGAWSLFLAFPGRRTLDRPGRPPRRGGRALAAGFALDRPPLIASASATLCASVALGAGNLVLTLRRLWSVGPGAPPHRASKPVP